MFKFVLISKGVIVVYAIAMSIIEEIARISLPHTTDIVAVALGIYVAALVFVKEFGVAPTKKQREIYTIQAMIIDAVLYIFLLVAFMDEILKAAGKIGPLGVMLITLILVAIEYAMYYFLFELYAKNILKKRRRDENKAAENDDNRQ